MWNSLTAFVYSVRPRPAFRPYHRHTLRPAHHALISENISTFVSVYNRLQQLVFIVQHIYPRLVHNLYRQQVCSKSAAFNTLILQHVVQHTHLYNAGYLLDCRCNIVELATRRILSKNNGAYDETFKTDCIGLINNAIDIPVLYSSTNTFMHRVYNKRRKWLKSTTNDIIMIVFNR